MVPGACFAYLLPCPLPQLVIELRCPLCNTSKAKCNQGTAKCSLERLAAILNPIPGKALLEAGQDHSRLNKVGGKGNGCIFHVRSRHFCCDHTLSVVPITTKTSTCKAVVCENVDIGIIVASDIPVHMNIECMSQSNKQTSAVAAMNTKRKT